MNMTSLVKTGIPAMGEGDIHKKKKKERKE
jgi:hypothetical protein